jgi:hypothetical protein
MEYVYHAHSGLRYLVLLAGALAALYLLFGLLGRRPYGGLARVLTSAFVGLLDLQALLGIVTLFVRPLYPALTGHIVMTLAAVGAAHALSIAARRSAEPRRKYVLSLAAVGVALVLVVGGIMAIGRGVFQSTLG